MKQLAITPYRKPVFIGLLLFVAGLSVLFFNKFYTASCEMPCGYLDNTRDIVIWLGTLLCLAGVSVVVGSIIRSFTIGKNTNK